MKTSSQILWLLLAAGILAPRISADEADERFLEGLRQRRLFVLGETFCRDRFAAGAMPLPDATRLTVERLRNLAEQAAHARPAERPRIVAQARQVAQEFVQARPTSSQSFLVRTQDALTSLAMGELARQEAEVAGAQDAAIENAKQLLREAAKALEQVEKELTQAIATRARKPAPEDELSLEELTNLAHHVRFQQARTLRNQGLCYADGHVDRVAALALSAEQLEKVRTQIAPDDPLGWRIRLDRSVCLRLLGKTEEARELVTAETFATAPAPFPLAATAERLRLLLAEPNLPAAERTVAQVQSAAATRFAELDLAVLEALFAFSQAADKAQNRTQFAAWQQQIAGWIELLERSHGTYWRRRAELLLVRSASLQRGDANVELVARSADSLYLQGQLDEAIAAYDKAASMLTSANDAQRRFDLLYKAALVEQKRDRFSAASQRLRELTLANKPLEKASDAHLLAGWLAAQQARREPSAMGAYQELLQENIATWPDHAAANQARLWLGNLYESQRAWSAAVGAYRGVPKSSPLFETGVAGAARAWPLWLAELRGQQKPAGPEATLAVSFLLATLRDDAGMWPTTWTELQRAVALVVARMQIEFLANGHAAAEELLKAALAAANSGMTNGSSTPSADWKSAAQSLLVMAVAGQPGRSADAGKLLEQMSGGSPQQMLTLVQSLAKMVAGASGEGRLSLAKLQLQVHDQLRPQREQLGEAAKQQFDLLNAEALAAAGRRDAAVAAFEQLAKQFPNDGKLQEKFATLLLDGPDVNSWRRALDQWRIIASRSPPQTAPWFRAKYSVALAQFRLGEKKAAAQLIRFLQATPPGLERTDMKPQFLELLQNCER